MMNQWIESAKGARPSVAGIVCTHDTARWEALSRAVASLQAQTYPLDEIIVVVDHEPVLYERARGELGGLTIVENRHSPGLSGARNTAAESAQSALLVYLDDDAVAAPDWVARLVAPCRDPSVLGVGGRVVPRWLERRPRWFPDEFLWVVGCTYRGMPARPAPVRNLYGGCFCIRRAVVTELGGFRTELGRVGSNRMGCEETELCIRAAERWAGSTFRYEPDALIEHDVPPERTRWSYFRSRCFAEGASKARLTRLVGAKHGLASERRHATRTLPAGVRREATRALLDRDPSHLGRCGAIIVGLGITTTGYASELRRSRRRPGDSIRGR